MANNTYVALDKITTTTSVSSVVFTSIPATYTDLVLICQVQQVTDGEDLAMQFNTDTTGTNYSRTYLCGDATDSHSGRDTSVARIRLDHHATPPTTGSFSTNIININNYLNTTTNKSVIARSNSLSTYAGSALISGVWRNTSAINSITLFCTNSSNIKSGSTFELYGIRAEGVSPTTKATGGAVYSDSTYYYHVFGASGTFTPTQSITADVLVVAGGGGAGAYAAGGGGAGGVITFTNQSLTATGYTCTVGSGGAKSTGDGNQSSDGGNSSFGALTAAVGGGGGGGRSASPSYAGHNGGSGGGGGGSGGTAGGSSTQTGSGATNYYGNAGGQAVAYAGAGGGGAGAAAGTSAVNTNNAGNGGVGIYNSLINAMGAATGTGELSGGNYYFAGGGCGFNGGSAVNTKALGGGGGADRGTGNGTANTGGGGGSTNSAGDTGNGGSGVIIVRYAK